MALPQDGQNANGLTKVTEIPTGKELIFIVFRYDGITIVDGATNSLFIRSIVAE